jgi:hypothetical protein
MRNVAHDIMWTPENLAALPTLCVGQADDLKVETDTTRVWLSRCSPEDGAYDEVTVERLNSKGQWVTAWTRPFTED